MMRYSETDVTVTARPNRWGTYTVRRLVNGEIVNTEIIRTYEDAMEFCTSEGLSVLSRWARLRRFFGRR